jgi:hypothetical protein
VLPILFKSSNRLSLAPEMYMRALYQRSFIAAAVGGLLSNLVGHPMVAWGASCSVQAAATSLGDDVWIHGVANCTGGVRGIRFFVGDQQVGETPGADGFATWHAAGAAGTYTIRVAASETSDSTWSHPVQTSLSLSFGPPAANDNAGPAAAAAPAQASPLTQLDAGQRDIYQRAIAALKHDPEYAGLGHPDADWTNLAARNDCLVLAMQIRNPDPASGEIGRPQLEMIAQIDDLAGRAKGTLIRGLSEQKELNGQFKSLAENFKTFLGVVQDFTWFGLFKAIGSIGFSELIGKPLAAQFQAHHFNRLYSGDASFVGFQQQRDKWGSGGEAIAHMVEEGALVEGGSLWDDWKSARQFFEALNAKAQLGWDNDTISNQVGQYLEQRYLTDTGGLDPWLAPVTKPEDGMENTLRDALHTMKLQLKDYLTSNLSDSCWQAPVTSSDSPVPVQAQPQPARPANYYVYLLGDKGGIGFYLGTDDDVTTTASCRFTGGGLCGPKDGPVTVFKKALGPYPTEVAARSALKQALVCQSGYWGPQGSWGGGWYWLQNNVTTADCKSLKVL